MTGHAFIGPGQVAPDRPAPDHCMACGLPEAAHRTSELSPLKQLGALSAVRQLEQIRLVLDQVFGDECADQQYALERIEEILNGGGR